jgi:N-acetylneuraminate synthase
VKHISRFESTRLTEQDFRTLVDAVHDAGLTSVVTPFDEPSVGQCLDHGVDILKVASCSAADWPLLEVIADAKRPVIASTGGMMLDDIDNLVSFFTHHRTEFALMHCVALYPTPNECANLNFLGKMCRRYPGLVIGYSGHEAPDNTEIGQLAIAKGARMLERHFGVPSGDVVLNGYSLAPSQADTWLAAIARARAMCGPENDKQVTQEEVDSLRALQRGVFAARPIAKGEVIDRQDVFFAMPPGEGQTTSGEFGRYRSRFVASRDYAAGEGIRERSPSDDMGLLRRVVHDAKGLLHEAGIPLGKDFEIEISHHYGIRHFRQTGAVIVNCFNREYCKKLIIMLPGQKHPNHRHRKKEETFQVLWGDLEVTRNNDESFVLGPGDQLLIQRGDWHRFETRSGVIFEEVSTTAHKNDSEYEDPEISRLDPIERKTLLEDF